MCVHYSHVQKRDGSIYFSLNGEFQCRVKIVYFTEFPFYLFAFDVLQYIIVYLAYSLAFPFMMLSNWLSHPFVDKDLSFHKVYYAEECLQPSEFIA